MSDDPIAKNKSLSKRALLEQAAIGLKQTPLFARMSRRLLFDLVERNGLQGLAGDATINESMADGVARGAFLAVVVLEGSVGGASRGAVESRVLRVGTYLRDDLAPSRVHFGSLELRTADKESEAALLVVIRGGTVWDSPATAWALDFTKSPILIPALAAPNQQQQLVAAIPPEVEEARRPELVWISASSDVDVPIVAAMHILGAAVARQAARMDSENPLTVFLLILGSHPQVLVWHNGHFQLIRLNPEEFLDRVMKEESSRHATIFVGNPDQPAHWSNSDFRGSIDRIVHLTTALPDVLPEEARKLLHDTLSAGRQESLFCSFITTVLVSERSSWVRCAERLCGGEFDTLPLPCGLPDESTRLYRDSVVLRTDTGKLQKAWSEWKDLKLKYPPFIDAATNGGGMALATAERWARAVTNRRVGVAFSGGGASAYRGGPLLKRIEAKLPIDVVAGLSGGSLLSAYYCHSAMKGFETLKRMAPAAQIGLPAVFVTTLGVELTTDTVLGHTRVEELEVRFAPVAVELPDDETPRTVVIRKGTLGEAIRVSGALPPTFAPTSKNCMRYTDGGAGCLVPAQVAKDCGADVVLSCNLIPGPSLGNPYYGISPGAGLLRRAPIFGRLVDSYTWTSYLLCQGSREYGTRAEVFVEFEPQPFPALESTLFVAVEWIIRDAERQSSELDCKVRKFEEAWKLLGTPKNP